MIYKLRDLIGDEHCKSGTTFGQWSRAVPLPFYGSYLASAWAVLRGRAVAVRYPVAGELEQALHETGGINIPPASSLSDTGDTSR